jgi:hypothetical protein
MDASGVRLDNGACFVVLATIMVELLIAITLDLEAALEVVSRVPTYPSAP